MKDWRRGKPDIRRRTLRPSAHGFQPRQVLPNIDKPLALEQLGRHCHGNNLRLLALNAW